MYVKDLKKNHKDVELIRPGLLVHSDSPFIRVSPDSIITCACHGSMLVEVKCPISHKNDNLQELALKGKLPYIQNKEGQLKVKKGESRGYYEQITLQQALSGENDAQLLIWGKKGYITVSMRFDQEYWEYIYALLKTFFEDYIVPEILTGRIKSEKEAKHTCTTTTILPICDSETDTTSKGSSHSNSDDDESHSELELEAEQFSNTCSDETACSQKSASTCSEDLVPCVADTDTAGSEPVLGCTTYCKDHRAPNFSKVKGQIIMCDSNLICPPNTGYHFFCEGFRRLPKEQDYLPYYACSKCRAIHPEKENISVNNGFYQ